MEKGKSDLISAHGTDVWKPYAEAHLCAQLICINKNKTPQIKTESNVFKDSENRISYIHPLMYAFKFQVMYKISSILDHFVFPGYKRYFRAGV